MPMSVTPPPMLDPAFEERLKQVVIDAVFGAMEETQKNETVLLSEKEAADFFGLRPQTLALWRHQGKGPVYLKLGSSVRYDFKELRAFIHNARVGR